MQQELLSPGRQLEKQLNGIFAKRSFQSRIIKQYTNILDEHNNDKFVNLMFLHSLIHVLIQARHHNKTITTHKQTLEAFVDQTIENMISESKYSSPRLVLTSSQEHLNANASKNKGKTIYLNKKALLEWFTNLIKDTSKQMPNPPLASYPHEVKARLSIPIVKDTHMIRVPTPTQLNANTSHALTQLDRENRDTSIPLRKRALVTDILKSYVIDTDPYNKSSTFFYQHKTYQTPAALTVLFHVTKTRERDSSYYYTLSRLKCYTYFIYLYHNVFY